MIVKAAQHHLVNRTTLSLSPRRITLLTADLCSLQTKESVSTLTFSQLRPHPSFAPKAFSSVSYFYPGSDSFSVCSTAYDRDAQDTIIHAIMAVYGLNRWPWAVFAIVCKRPSVQYSSLDSKPLSLFRVWQSQKAAATALARATTNNRPARY